MTVESCHTDDITFRLWQPLPPYVYDEDGNRLWGNEQCYNTDDGEPCLVPGCEVSFLFKNPINMFIASGN